MLKTAASIVACAAVLVFVAPLQGQSTLTSADTVAGEMCKGDKKKDKDVEKPSESDTLLSMCEKGEKKKKRGEEKPAE